MYNTPYVASCICSSIRIVFTFSFCIIGQQLDIGRRMTPIFPRRHAVLVGRITIVRLAYTLPRSVLPIRCSSRYCLPLILARIVFQCILSCFSRHFVNSKYRVHSTTTYACTTNMFFAKSVNSKETPTRHPLYK